MSVGQFSVIIPTRHRNDELAKCLDCLAPGMQELGSEAYEVIVTDDGSNTTAEALIREQYPWARWTPGPRRGPAANRNNGAAQAAGEWLVFTDDDCLPSAGWLKAYSDAREQASVLEGLTRTDRARRSYAEESPINLTGGYLWSCNFSIKKKLFHELAGFDENFPAPAMEDCDFRENLREAGIPFCFIKSAEVVHPWRQAKGWDFWESHLQAVIYYYRKHPHLGPKHPTTSYFLNSLRFFKNNVFVNYRSVGTTGIFHALIRFAWDMWTSIRFRYLLAHYAAVEIRMRSL